MELEEDRLIIDRELSELDKKVLDFLEILENAEIKYAVVSGYVAILTGRSRGTEDIDILIERVCQEKLEEMSSKLAEAGYWCINEKIAQIPEMLEDNVPVRVAEEGEVIPNFEIFVQQDRFEKKALEQRLEAKLDEERMFISPLELQIAYKLWLGSEKDYEDALHIYSVFKDKLEAEKLELFASKLDVEEDLDELRT